jgi:type II secretory pathway predicted ATPase ExeA
VKHTPPTASAADLFDQSPRESPFPYRDYVAASNALLAAIRKGPFYALVTGETGTGKTTLPREISQKLDRGYKILYLSSSSVSPPGVSNFLAESLRVAPRRSHVQTAKAIADVLKAEPVHHIFWVDQADKASQESLTVVLALAEGDLAVPQLLSVVFSGLPELRTALDARELFPLKRRITVRCTLAGLARDEVDAFLVHRLGGAAAQRLPVATKDEIFERAKGSPALVAKAARTVLERMGEGPGNEDTLREGIHDAGL